MSNKTNHLNKKKDTQKPRICLLTTRHFAHNAFRCGFYEAQDVLMEIDDVDLIYLEPRYGYELRKDLHEKIIWHDHTHCMLSTNLTLKPVHLDKEYDLFIVYLPYFQDIIHLPAIKNWKKCCKSSVLWVNELWLKDVENPKFSKTWLAAFKQFDHIAIGLDATAKRLSTLLNRHCEFIPTGVDSLRFSPNVSQKDRCIDIYSMGRAWPELHKHLLELANQQNLFYLFDTFNTGGAKIGDYRQHREMSSHIIKRSQYFLVAPAKMDASHETAGQIEIGARYFEGAAAGAVLLGQAPQCDAFKRIFNWPDAVIEIQQDGSDVAAVLNKLSIQPERLIAISRRNARESLLHHDWLYRWKQILKMTSLKTAPQLALREDKLHKKAQQIAVQAANFQKDHSEEKYVTQPA